MLTKLQLIDNAQKALDEGRLQFFKPDSPKNHRMCRYRDGEYCCAVGASIPDCKYYVEMDDPRGHGPTLRTILFHIGGDADELREIASILQSEHDELTIKLSRSKMTIEEAKSQFQTVLDNLRKYECAA